MEATDRDEVAEFVRVLSPEHKGSILDIVYATGALEIGHFAFSDRHTSAALRFRAIGRIGAECGYLAQLLVQKAGIDRGNSARLNIFAPQASGHFLAAALADVLGKPRTEIVVAEPHFHDRRPSDRYSIGAIREGDEVVVVNDVDDTGESAHRMIGRVQRSGGTVKAFLAFGACNPVEHVQRMTELGVPSHYLAEINLPVLGQDRSACPYCLRGQHPEPVSGFR